MTTIPGQAELWNGAAGEVWARCADELDRRLVHFGQATMEALAPQPGERILDVGCGAGAMSRELVRCVGSGGHVTGVDISGPLLAAARARGGAVHYLQADAAEADFGTTFDAIYSRFGVMFFADPQTAFANLRRTAPRGRLAFVCWRGLTENPAMTRPLEVARHILPEIPPLEPDAPGPFSFADRERVEHVLRGAGWESIVVTPHDSMYELGPDADAATGMALTIGPLSRALREVPDETEAVRSVLHRTFTADAGPDGVVAYPAATWIVTAR